MAVFNQWKHIGERNSNRVIVSNLGISYDKKTKKQDFDAGYLVICKCGWGFIIPRYDKFKSGKNYKCPYCGRKEWNINYGRNSR